jgi:hypothetical protein
MSAPVLPGLTLMQWWSAIAWAMVLAGCASGLLARRPFPLLLRMGVPLLLAVWAVWPGEGSAAFWLGLAFQSPSAVFALGSAWWGWSAWRATLRPALVAGRQPEPFGAELGLAYVAVAAGWILLLDTFAQLPVEAYAFGFTAQAVAAVAAVAVLPLLQAGAIQRGTAWLLPLALLMFVALRLPTGNVWDAVLDPWLWVVSHGLLVRSFLQRRSQRLHSRT